MTYTPNTDNRAPESSGFFFDSLYDLPRRITRSYNIAITSPSTCLPSGQSLPRLVSFYYQAFPSNHQGFQC